MKGGMNMKIFETIKNLFKKKQSTEKEEVVKEQIKIENENKI